MKPIYFILFLLTAHLMYAQTDTDLSVGEMQSAFRNQSFLKQYYQNLKQNKNEAVHLNPGIDPDGDEQGQACFTIDGEQILVTNGLTNNVTVLDWETQIALANIEVGEYPVHVDVSEDYAVVACLFDSSVYVIDLIDYSIASVLEMPGQAYYCEVNPDGSKVYAQCFVDTYSTVEVFSLNDFSHELSFDNIPALPYLQSWVTGSGRQSLKFFTFGISYENEILFTPDAIGTVFFYDLNTGDLIAQTPGIKSLEFDMSLDENTVVFISFETPATLFQLDINTQNVVDDFALNIGTYAGSLSCNADGSRAFFGGDNMGHIIDFNDDSHQTFSTNTAFWSETTSDKRYVYSANYKASVLDFDTKSIVGIHQGNTQGYVTVSPVGYKALAYNNLFWEGGFFYDFSSLSSLDYLGKQFFGNPPEGDIPFRVQITNDGQKAVVTNPGSWTISVVDLSNNTVSSVLDVEENSKWVEITNDGNWAVISGYDMNQIKIVDLVNEEVSAFITTNQRPGPMIISPDNEYVYVMNIKANTISKVHLDGANSSELAEVACGTIGGIYSAYGIYSDIEITPDGQYIIACISFEDHVKIIETEGMTVVKELATGVFPLQVAINASGTHATVTNQGEDSFSVIELDGANSSIVGTFTYGLGNPIRVKYNEILDQMMIVDYQHTNYQWKVLHTNPTTGTLINTEIHDGFGATLDADFASDGTPVILTGAEPLDGGTFGKSHVLMGDEAFAIGDGPIAFDVDPVNNIAVCACGGGGSDLISIISLNSNAFPDILVDQNALELQADSGDVDFENLLISNVGVGALNYDIEINYGKTSKENWLTISPESGTLNPGFDQEIQVSAHSQGLEEGIYEADLIINSNDPDQPQIIVDISFEVISTVGIPEQTNTSMILQPNPVTDLLNIHSDQYILSYRMINTLGQVVMNQYVNTKSFQISLEGLEKGHYFIELKSSEGTEIHQIIKN